MNPHSKEQFAIVPGTDGKGTPIFSVLVKRTYGIGSHGGLMRCDPPQALVEADQYYDNGNPQWSTVLHESDLVSYKPATDVVILTDAYAPKGRPAAFTDVSVRIDDFQKRLRVFGDRKCSFRDNLLPVITDPEYFTRMPLRYEKAYGGWDRASDPQMPFFYPRNPMGTGAAVKNLREVIEGLKLPNIEDPGDLLTPERILIGEPGRWNDQPLPQGLGWFQKTWYPRCSYIGAMPPHVNVDTVLREETLGMVPRGQVAQSRRFQLPAFDARFNNGASFGLVRPYLSGNERITLNNLTPEGELTFNLPGDTPAIMLDIGLGENELEPVAHSVSIRVEQRQVDLVWRGAQRYPGFDWLPQMKRLHAEVR